MHRDKASYFNDGTGKEGDWKVQCDSPGRGASSYNAIRGTSTSSGSSSGPSRQTDI